MGTKRIANEVLVELRQSTKKIKERDVEFDISTEKPVVYDIHYLFLFLYGYSLGKGETQ